MGRVNKATEGVFVGIVGNAKTISSYDLFMKKEGISKEVKPYLNQYKSTVTKTKVELEKLAALEEIIMQIRSKEDLDDIKLSLVREYVYARCPFYRRNKTAKEIRVIVDNIEFWDKEGKDVDKLYDNTDFMQKAKNKIAAAMKRETEENIKVFKTLYKK